MSTELRQVIAFHPPEPRPPEVPLPEFCGPGPDFVPYLWTTEHRRKRVVRARKSRYAALAYYRIQADRSAARGNQTAATWYAERAQMYARLLRPKVATSDEVYKPASVREEVRSWVVMAEVIASEAHLTAADYLYA